jgi:hypothetical protein
VAAPAAQLTGVVPGRVRRDSGPATRCPSRRTAPTLDRVPQQSEGVQLSEEPAPAPSADDRPTGGAVLLFIGGPLDGRVEVRDARHGDPLPTITHVHLHGGPKVVHRYDLQELTDQAWIYHVRPSARRPVRDDATGE